MCEFTRLLRTKSTILYLPPNGTDGFERNAVNGKSLSPLPPARTNARTFGCAIAPPLKFIYLFKGIIKSLFRLLLIVTQCHSCPVSKYGINSSRNPEKPQELDSVSRCESRNRVGPTSMRAAPTSAESTDTLFY